MTTIAPDLLTPGTAQRAGRVARMASLVRAELLLLARNRTTLFNAVALAPLTVGFIAVAGLVPDSAAGAVAGMLLAALIALALVLVVYYNLTTTIVARREELEIGRASCRERVMMSGCGGVLNKHSTHHIG